MADTEIERFAPAALKPWARNARTHSRAQVRAIAESIRTFGFTNPVLIDDDNTILAGHGRVAAAKRLKMDAVPCLRLKRLAPEAKRAYVLADNRLALDAGWDEALLAEELKALQAVELDFDISVTGFSLPEIDRLAGDAGPPEQAVPRGGRGARDVAVPEPDAAPEADTEPARCRPGDVWRLGPHRLICGEGPEAEAAACDRLVHCWEAFAGELAKRLVRSVDGRTGEAG